VLPSASAASISALCSMSCSAAFSRPWLAHRWSGAWPRASLALTSARAAMSCFTTASALLCVAMHARCSGRHRPSCWAALTSAPLAMSQGSSLLSGAVACIARAWCSVLRPTASTSSSCTFVGASSPAAATPPPAVAEAEAAAASLVGHRGRHDAAPVVAAEAAAVPTLPTALRRASSSEASRSCRCDCAASSAGVTACPSGAVVEASRWSSAATACGARARTARWLVAKSGRVSDRTAGTNARPQRRFWRQCGERPSLGPRAQP